MSRDRDEIRADGTVPDDERGDADLTGEFSIDFTPPAWYLQDGGGDTGSQPVPASPPVAPTAPPPAPEPAPDAAAAPPHSASPHSTPVP